MLADADVALNDAIAVDTVETLVDVVALDDVLASDAVMK